MGNTTGFIGFSGLPEGTYIPALNVISNVLSEQAELNIPGDFRMTLRKMGKKDVTTKIKALQEFTEHVQGDSSIEVLKSVLPFWARIFTRLVIDGDRRVRENVLKAHASFATKIGRDLAPQLKELMGAWFTSQCDNYTPASTAAVNSLASCFPEKKLPVALSFCHNEIMDYIHCSIFKEEEYSEEQMERVLVGGLAGYSLLLQQVSGKDLADNESILEKHSNFWKNGKLYKVVHKDSSIIVKQAWFGLVYSLSEFLPNLAQGIFFEN